MKHFVYILQTLKGHYYTGYTVDLNKRMKAHQKGKGAKFTRTFGFKKLLYHELFAEKSQALKREAAIKKLSRAEKVKIIKGL